MNISVDTNVLIRGVVRDDAEQARAADTVLRGAKFIAISTSCLCEFAWVLRRVYRLSSADIGTAIRALNIMSNAEMDRLAVQAGLALLDAGGDFADGVIAYEGSRLGGETFVSFDKQAVAKLATQGYKTLRLS